MTRLEREMERLSNAVARLNAVLRGEPDPGDIWETCDRKCGDAWCPTPMGCSGGRGKYKTRKDG